MKAWTAKALDLLHASLQPPKHELNELDWKAGLSPDTKRLTEHLSTFGNHPGGGFPIYGIDSAGNPSSPITATAVSLETVDFKIAQAPNPD